MSNSFYINLIYFIEMSVLRKVVFSKLFVEFVEFVGFGRVKTERIDFLK